MPTPLGLLLATVAGIAMPAQGRVNGALAAELGSGTLAALVSFTVGLVIVGLGVLIFPKSRSSIKQLPTFLKEKRFPWWYMLAGVIGAYFVLGQGLTITLLGVALFTVANVAGQTISGLFTDAIGFGPGGKRPITGIRFIGSFLAIVGVLWAVWPKIAAQGASGDWLLPVLFPLSAGLLFAFQQAMNGTQTRYYRTPLPATFFNFAAGTLALGVVVLITSFGNPLPGHFPTGWWMYLGGAFGNVFIATGAILVRHMGVLLTGLGLVAGQLLGSLALDVFAPVPGSVVDANTLWGTALTLVAVMIASIPSSARMPWEKR
ncbi:hypothetical protein BHE16_04555 [Neomicrococcus aestuarii]|uniref:EamA-like transporter family protein n=1 Tax=Neomicrococcus aestuarii TaxID=556325 RepID=A0A1L2ZQJ2_9MICC|nr:hypothetical protein BHE16_04555 [Neomicrococcus aestuarii]